MRFGHIREGHLLLTQGLVTAVQFRFLERSEEQLDRGTSVHVGPEHHHWDLLLFEEV